MLPPCDVGRHNWKIDDAYDLACGLQRIELVASPRRDTFPSDMEALDRALRAEGWTPSPVRGMDDVVPGTSYSKADAGRERTLAISWTAHGSSAEPVSWWAEDPDHAEPQTAGGDGAHVSYLLAAIPADGYGVVATEGAEYFRE